MDPLYIGIIISFLTMFGSFLFLIYDFDIAGIFHPQQKEKESDLNVSSSRMNIPKSSQEEGFTVKNPVRTLENLYNIYAEEEIKRCLQDERGYKDLCHETMSLLLDGCKDQVTRIAACDNPLLERKITTMKES